MLEVLSWKWLVRGLRYDLSCVVAADCWGGSSIVRSFVLVCVCVCVCLGDSCVGCGIGCVKGRGYCCCCY